MFRIVTAAVLLAGALRVVEAAPCTLDRQRYASLGSTGFGEALLCDAKQLDDVWVRFSQDRITAIHWTEYQGENLRRTIQIYDSGRIAFIVEDRSVKGGFWAQSRGTSHFVFPRGRAMSVEQDSDGRLTVHDAAGHVWQLARTRRAGKGTPRVSHVVIAIDGTKQRTVPISFAKQGVVGVDLVATRTLYLQHEEPNLSGLADRRSRAYTKTKSIFHDSQGRTCAVANEQLFVPSPSDPNDKSDNELRFDDDASLAAFLTKTCPALDLAALAAAPTSTLAH